VERTLEPELLDELPPNDPKAVRSRRDLKRLNWLMRNKPILADVLLPHAKEKAVQRYVDLGAGDGTFALGVAEALAKYQQNLHVVLVDRQSVVRPETHEGFHHLGCTVETVSADVFDWLMSGAESRRTFFTANLFLHHFHEAELCELFYLAAKRADVFAACEPRRSMMSLRVAQCIGLIGCNSVTRHDAVVSVRAGFVKRELSEMWPGEGNWILQERSAGMFSHLFVAQRK
jgi:hypothetical protein